MRHTLDGLRDIPEEGKMKHDFKGALNDVDKGYMPDAYMEFDICNSYYETIKTALRLAHRLQSGEVSEGMVRVTRDNEGLPVFCFKAMARQLIKECEDGKE